MINMLDLYDEMKSCLKYLGLSFGDMHAVVLIYKDNGVVRFEYGNRAIEIDFKAEPL